MSGTMDHLAGKTIIGNFNTVFDAMFGPQQHDAHVERWRKWKYLREEERVDGLRMKAVEAEVQRINAAYRRR